MWAFIGAGNMAGAILRGLGEDHPPLLLGCAEHASVVAFGAECGIEVAPTNRALAERLTEEDVLVLGVKPYQFAGLMEEIADVVVERRPQVISIAAGTVSDTLPERLPGVAITRAMPNIAAEFGMSTTALAALTGTTDKARKIFEKVGSVVELPVSQFAAFSAIAGCSTAFTMAYVDALARGGVAAGMKHADAYKAAIGAVAGAGVLASHQWGKGIHPAQVRDAVCSPGGTTIAGLNALDHHGFQGAVLAAVEAAIERDRSM